jgi:hypothetical protein
MSSNDDTLKNLSKTVQLFVDECNTIKTDLERRGELEKAHDVSMFINAIVELEGLCLQIKREGPTPPVHYHECLTLH